jgi:ribosomal protein S18 acetylase RimI-like enzyme
MGLKYSTSRRPSPESVKRLYLFAHWASKRKLADIRRMIAHTPMFFTAWEGTKLIGMARCSSDFTFRAVLWDVIIDPEYTRQGVGSKLVRSALRHPSLTRVESFWLSTTDKQNFYKRFGFKLNSKNIMVLRKDGRS